MQTPSFPETPSDTSRLETATRSDPWTRLYVPVRKELVLSASSLDLIVSDLNARVQLHGAVVLPDGQFLNRDLHEANVFGTWFEDDHVCEVEETSAVWGPAQTKYFGALLGTPQPYHLGRSVDVYGPYYIGVDTPGPFLADGERILAIVDATADQRDFECPCHSAEVIYTDARRLVCMGCGYMHCVLAELLPGVFDLSWTDAQWNAAFDSRGLVQSHDLRPPFVEFQDVFRAPKIWTTAAWDEASGEIEFFARGDPEEIRRFRASQPTAQDLLAAGFEPVPEPPSPARQMATDGFGFDLVGNALEALNDAAHAYDQSASRPSQLRAAVLNGFQSTELLLKARLRHAGCLLDVERLTNSQALAALETAGVGLEPADAALVVRLRRLRNKLQHAGAAYGFADTRLLLEQIFVFLDRLAADSLGLWVGAEMEPSAWRVLLRLPAIEANAAAQVIASLEHWRAIAGNEVKVCLNCRRATVASAIGRADFCLFCRTIPFELLE